MLPKEAKMNLYVKNKIKQGLTLLIILVALLMTITLMVTYYKYGDKNMEFYASEMIVVSSVDYAEIKNKENSEENAEEKEQYKWNYNLNQYNDIYMYFTKNFENNNQASSEIKSVKIENLHYKVAPKMGDLKLIKPTGDKNHMFNYEEESFADEIIYTGEENGNFSKLEINEQGGVVLFRIANINFTELKSNDDEIVNDGTLIKKAGVNYDDLKFEATFDVVVDVGTKKYRANVDMELPYENISEQGITKLQNKDLSDIKFIRE